MQDVTDFINKKVGYEIEMFVSEKHDEGVNLFHKARGLGIQINRVTIDKKSLEMTADTIAYDQYA